MDTAVLAAIIGAVATIVSTWLSRWSPKTHHNPSVQTVVASPVGEPLPLVGGWQWVGYLGWDVLRLSVRNVSIFALFVVLVIALQQLGVGKSTRDQLDNSRPQYQSRQSGSGSDNTWVVMGMLGGAASLGLGVAEGLTRWSPWRRSQTSNSALQLRTATESRQGIPEA